VLWSLQSTHNDHFIAGRIMQLRERLFFLVVGAAGLANDVVHNVGSAWGLQVRRHPAEGDAENIAVMQFRPGAARAEL
jgi:hypothetical protein